MVSLIIKYPFFTGPIRDTWHEFQLELFHLIPFYRRLWTWWT